MGPVAYAIHNQRNRRNLDAGDILRCVEALDRKRERGGDRKSPQAKSKGSEEPIDKPRSAAQTAEVIGTSPATVKRARAVIEHAPAAVRQAVDAGETIFALWLACYTQEQIAEAVGLSQPEVNATIGEVSQMEGLPKPILLLARHEEADWAPPLYDMWTADRNRNETKHFGRARSGRRRTRAAWTATNSPSSSARPGSEYLTAPSADTSAREGSVAARLTAKEPCRNGA